ITDRVGRRLDGVAVELLDAAGSVVGHGVTDRFGLYRIDRVPPGTYTLRMAPGQFPGAELPVLEVSVTDDFLFSQDLQLPVLRGDDQDVVNAPLVP
ncbi:MAG: hypothetical protein C3F15_14960, partial [Holophagae bacterium]